MTHSISRRCHFHHNLASLTCLLALAACGESKGAATRERREPAPEVAAARFGQASAGAPGPAYFAIDRVGLVRLDARGFRTVLATDSLFRYILAGADDTVYAGRIGGVFAIAPDGTARKVGDSSQVGQAAAVDGEGNLFAFDARGPLRKFDGKVWTEVAAPPDSAVRSPRGIAFAPGGKLLLGTFYGVYELRGSKWKAVDTAMGDNPLIEAIVTGPDGAVYVVASQGVYRSDGESWTKFAAKRAFQQDGLGVGWGRGVLFGRDGLTLFDNETTRGITLGALGVNSTRINRAASDGRGRTWVSTDVGVVILGPDGALLQQWKPGTVAQIAGEVSAILIAGSGPELPELGAVKKGFVRGRVLVGGKAAVGAAVEMCASPATMLHPGETPCKAKGNPWVFRYTTSADGEFAFKDVPISSYGFAAKPRGAGKWSVGFRGEICCTKLEEGKTLDIGALEIR